MPAVCIYFETVFLKFSVKILDTPKDYKIYIIYYRKSLNIVVKLDHSYLVLSKRVGTKLEKYTSL